MSKQNVVFVLENDLPFYVLESILYVVVDILVERRTLYRIHHPQDVGQ